MAKRKPASKKTATSSKTGRKSASATTETARTAPVTDNEKSAPAPKTTVSAIADPAPVEAPEASLVTVVKKKDLIEKVTEASGVKRSEAKKVIEAMLKELGDALQREDELNLPPLGKMSVNRIREGSGAHIIIAKLRRPKAMLGEVTTPASTADDTAVDEA
jgi:hypothetical protein